MKQLRGLQSLLVMRRAARLIAFLQILRAALASSTRDVRLRS